MKTVLKEKTLEDELLELQEKINSELFNLKEKTGLKEMIKDMR